jgi:hypothetical protein
LRVEFWMNTKSDKLNNIIFLLIAVLSTACAGGHPGGQLAAGGDHPRPPAYFAKVAALSDDLAALNHHTNSTEAGDLAQTAISYSYRLAEEYRVVRPAVFHNLLVRIGLKDRGLCYQWTEDLMTRLDSMQLKSFQLHWGVAYRGSELREHNTVVVTARGQPFEDGIVLDPWRNSGELFWARVKKDHYPWQERMPGE